MEFRRQQLALKKVDEEKARALEEEKRVKEEAEKKRKEREDNTDKLPLKASTAKKVRSCVHLMVMVANLD